MTVVRASLIAIALLLASGCSSWHAVPLRPEVAPVVDAKHPVRVTQANQTSVVLWRPHVVGDSLVGEVGNPPLRTAVAWRDVQRLEVLGASAARTAGAVGVGLGVGALLLGIGFLGIVVLLISAG